MPTSNRNKRGNVEGTTGGASSIAPSQRRRLEAVQQAMEENEQLLDVYEQQIQHINRFISLCGEAGEEVKQIAHGVGEATVNTNQPSFGHPLLFSFPPCTWDQSTSATDGSSSITSSNPDDITGIENDSTKTSEILGNPIQYLAYPCPEAWTEQELEDLKNAVTVQQQLQKQLDGRSSAQGKRAAKQGGSMNWAVVAGIVGSKSRHQCWYAWKEHVDPRLLKDIPFSDDELTRLKDVVDEHECHDWEAIAQEMSEPAAPGSATGNSIDQVGSENTKNNATATNPNRYWTAHICFQAYLDHICEKKQKPDNGVRAKKMPNARTSYWDEEERQRLLDAVAIYTGRNRWTEISRHVGTRTSHQCYRRYIFAERPGKMSGKWSKQEDKALLDAVQKLGSAWSLIAKEVGTRTNAQCKNRYEQHLRPEMRSGTFSAEEVTKAKQLYDTIGPKWAEMGRILNRKGSSLCKLIRRSVGQNNAGSEDDENVVEVEESVAETLMDGQAATS